MKKLKKLMSLVLTCVLLIILSGTTFAKEDTVKPFSDVPENHWAYKAIHDLRSLGITEGIGDNCFGMGQTIKRSEFVTFLTKLMNWELIKPEKGSFTDNQDTAKWYYAPIETALKHGTILKDTERFRPDDPITREEMAIMIVRTLGYNSLAVQIKSSTSSFDDVTENKNYIAIARDFGIISGVGNNLFKPYDTAKREEAAVMMMKMYEKLNISIKELHAFYAIQSAHQMDKISSLDSVSFGWSRLEYDAQKGQVVLNTTGTNNNQFSFPEGFTEPLIKAKESNVSTQLMVYASNNTVFSTQTKSNIPLVEYIITDAQIREQVIKSIVDQINSTYVEDGSQVSFNGVVIDFEDMRGEGLKRSFNLFLAELKNELNKTGKLLYVAVHPAGPAGSYYYDGYDFKAIGEIADKVILMAHDYYAKQLEDVEMRIGYTLTPLTPINEIYYALRAITDKDTGIQDLDKIWLQLSFDSVQWKLKDGKVINKYPYNPGYDAIYKRLVMDGVTVKYSDSFQNPCALYYDDKDGTDNVLWYEDSRSIQAKIDMAKMFGIRGISVWRLGNIPDYEEQGANEIYLNVWNQIMQNTEKANN